MQESFYRGGLSEDTHSFCVLHDSVFALVQQVSIQVERHILWIHEGKGPKCELCDYRPTRKSIQEAQTEWMPFC